MIGGVVHKLNMGTEGSKPFLNTTILRLPIKKINTVVEDMKW